MNAAKLLQKEESPAYLESGESLLWEGPACRWPLRFPWWSPILLWLGLDAFARTQSTVVLVLALALALYAVFDFLRVRHTATRLRFAITDRRVLAERAGRIAEAVPRESIAALLPFTGPAAASIACFSRPADPSVPPAPAIVLGPLRPADAPAAGDALRRMLGRLPLPDAPPEHAFPAWMPQKIRRAIAEAFSLDGERLLWAGRPVWRLNPWDFILFFLGVGALLVALLDWPGKKPFAEVVADTLSDAAQQLASGPLGFFSAILTILIIPGLFLLVSGALSMPFLNAALRRRSLCLVTTHRVAILYSRMVSSKAPPNLPRSLLPAPRAVPRGKRRADLVFDTRPPLVFRDLPAEDISAALAAFSAPSP